MHRCWVLARSTADQPARAQKPVAVTSLGTVPGVSRVVLRHADGRQESYGGYASGMGANALNNSTAVNPAAMGLSRRPDADEPDVGSFTTQRDHYEASHLRLELDDDVPAPRPLHAPAPRWLHSAVPLAASARKASSTGSRQAGWSSSPR